MLTVIDHDSIDLMVPVDEIVQEVTEHDALTIHKFQCGDITLLFQKLPELQLGEFAFYFDTSDII
jgi:hypothetical protein